MNIFQNVTLFCITGTLAACSSSSPTPPLHVFPGTAENNAGVYSVTEDGVTTTMSGTPSSGYFKRWNDPDYKAFLYETSDVIALAGMSKTTFGTFAGISGTPTTSIPGTGTASYEGQFSAGYFRQRGTGSDGWVPSVVGYLTTNVDFESGAVSATGTGNYSSSLTINGSIVGTNFTGTAEFSALESGGAATVPLAGGFYGADTIVAIYKGDTVAGIFHGVKTP